MLAIIFEKVKTQDLSLNFFNNNIYIYIHAYMSYVKYGSKVANSLESNISEYAYVDFGPGYRGVYLANSLP